MPMVFKLQIFNMLHGISNEGGLILSIGVSYLQKRKLKKKFKKLNKVMQLTSKTTRINRSSSILD